ncbi:hypothetical protein F0726_02967 [Acidithiobacillus caldus]|nr:hypothetical protein F0726_02967 [Acidithiobacillus caldus]
MDLDWRQGLLRYYAVCLCCGSYFSVPEHVYFQMREQRAEKSKKDSAT